MYQIFKNIRFVFILVYCSTRTEWRGIKVIYKTTGQQSSQLKSTYSSVLPTSHGSPAEEWEQSCQESLAQKHPLRFRDAAPALPALRCPAPGALPGGAGSASRPCARLRPDCEVTWSAWWSTQKLLALHICNIMDSQGGACYKNTQWNTTGGLLFLKG